MRALLLASAGVLVLAACDQAGDTAVSDDAASEAAVAAVEEAPPAPPPGPPPGFGGPNPAIEEARRNNPRVGPDRTADYAPDSSVAEQRAPNSWTLGGLEPAFPEQTKAPVPASTHAWRVENVASGFTNPWGFDFLPDGDVLISERIGQFRIVGADGAVGEPIAGPDVWAQGQGGLFDVALAPDFESTRNIYFAASPVVEGDSITTTVLYRARLADDESAIENVEELFRANPPTESPGHFGGRIAIDEGAGVIFLTLGDRMDATFRMQAQDTETHVGGVIRLNLDGSVPADNPFVDGPAPELWSYGHRSNQAADFDPITGALWTVEHGPRGGDELNLTEAGKNYGWPIVCYCIDYSGAPIGEFESSRADMEEPVYYWDPVIAPGGMGFYTGDLFPEWQNDLFVAGEGSMRLSRLVFNEERTRVVGEEWLPMESRIRQVKTGPDGALWGVTEEAGARLFRIVPE